MFQFCLNIVHLLRILLSSNLPQFEINPDYVIVIKLNDIFYYSIRKTTFNANPNRRFRAWLRRKDRILSMRRRHHRRTPVID